MGSLVFFVYLILFSEGGVQKLTDLEISFPVKSIKRKNLFLISITKKLKFEICLKGFLV